MVRAARGAPGGAVVVAERQTAGRGRMGREWIAAPGGSLTFSLLWRFPVGTKLSGLSLAVGVAVSRALEKVMGSGIHSDGAGGTALKWPNDILLLDRKLGGILIELSGAAAVIGIGLNLRLPESMPEAIRTTAAALDGEIDPNTLLAAVLEELLRVLDGFALNGFAALRDEWLSRHAWTGRLVRVLTPHAEPIEGICVGVADDGALLLETAGGVKRILSGDVSLRLKEGAPLARQDGSLPPTGGMSAWDGPAPT